MPSQDNPKNPVPSIASDEERAWERWRALIVARLTRPTEQSRERERAARDEFLREFLR